MIRTTEYGMGALARALLAVACLAFVLHIGTCGKTGAQAGDWHVQELDGGPSEQPVLVADSTGQIHGLWVSKSTESVAQDAIMYARRNALGKWSAPMDVIVPPSGTAISSLEAVVDSQDQIHLIFTSQDGLYYSRARLAEADRFQGWSPPVLISHGQAGPSSIVLGHGDVLHVIFPRIYTPPDSVFYVGSTDGGANWSSPVAISAPKNPKTEPVTTQLAVGSSGRLHAVWTETIELFPPAGVFHAFSDDGGASWSPPQPIAEGGYSWISVGPEVDDRRVHLVWTGTGAVVGKYHALSTDGGETWGPSEKIFYGWAGFLGNTRFGLDGSGQLHLVAALGGDARLPDTSWHGMSWHSAGDIFHSVWQDNQWTVPDHISSDVSNPNLENQFPALAFDSDDHVSVAWSAVLHPEDKASPIYYAQIRAPATETGKSGPHVSSTTGLSPIIAAAVPVPTEAVTPTTTIAEPVAMKPFSSGQESARVNSSQVPLIISVGLTSFLIVTVVVYDIARRRQKNRS